MTTNEILNKYTSSRCTHDRNNYFVCHLCTLLVETSKNNLFFCFAYFFNQCSD